jgi:DNA-binding CsgD family transcriptional regulator
VVSNAPWPIPEQVVDDQAVPHRLALDFVGRQAELRLLQSAFAAAAAGQGGLVTLVGEPGIGKTALCDQVASFVSSQGGRALVGHCHPSGSFNLPYQPFVEAFEREARERDADALRSEMLDADTSEIARIVPMLRDLLNVELSEPGDPEEDRWRLIQSVKGFVRSAAARHPLLLVLEDLHDADRGTLDLLLHLAHSLNDMRLLVVGTYRDVDVDRAHPLSAALVELRRGGSFVRVHLGGLSTDEVQHFLARSSQLAIARPFAELVHQRTEGNPLFVHELLRCLVEEGMVEARNGALRRVGDESLARRIPEGLKDAVSIRLSRLNTNTNQLLSLAAVVGRDFPLDVLRRVLARSDDEMEASLEEAVAAGVVEERSVVGATVVYRFSHAFFRETLYDEIIAPRRIRLHQQIARATEEMYAGRLDEHAAELAEHFSFSSERADLVKAVQYGQLAAEHATGVFASGEAVRQLERALQLHELGDGENRTKTCELLVDLGHALLAAGEPRRVLNAVAPEALRLAEALGDVEQASKVCQLSLFALNALHARADTADVESWAEAADRVAPPGTLERVWADATLGRVKVLAGDWQSGQRLLEDALVLARRLDNNLAVWVAGTNWLFATNNLESVADISRRTAIAEELWGRSRAGVSAQLLRSAFTMLFTTAFFVVGERDRAEAVEAEVQQMSDRLKQPNFQLRVALGKALLAWLDGRFDDVIAITDRSMAEGRELGLTEYAASQSVCRKLTLLVLGRADESLRTSWSGSAPGARLADARALVALGRKGEALEIVEEFARKRAAAASSARWPYWLDTILLQTALEVAHRQALSIAMPHVEALASMCALSTAGCTARLLGDAAAFLGDRAAARTHYASALEVTERMRARGERALTVLGLAELQLSDDFEERAEGRRQLEFAISEFEAMNMRPALARAMDLALTTQTSLPRPSASSTDPSNNLTARELEITALLARGMSNRDIADALVISDGTVGVHVKHILGKLGFRSRTQVATWWADQRSEKKPENAI